MKKGLSAILLIIFLFNVGGYYIVFWGLQYQTDRELTSRLDANTYTPEETILLKIPVTLPYPIASRGFERVDGRFEYNGEHFKLIKNKLQNDTLYVVCIRDRETRQLVKTIKDYMKLTQGIDATTPSQKALNFLGKLVKDFCSGEETSIVHYGGFQISFSFEKKLEHFIQPVVPVSAPPPRA